MKTLEELIRENRKLLDTDEPSAGHMRRFRNKLLVKAGTRSVIWYKRLDNIAAAILIFAVLAGALTISIFNYNATGESLNITSQNSELLEVEQYYNNMINKNILTIKNHPLAGKSKITTSVLNELKEMDGSIEQVKNDLKFHPNDERIIDALINQYQLKLEITNNLLNITIRNS
ncbi:MAG: hypothetical protein JXJ22_09245 [Bacteroidales bacterium]|nr:hypothetical protein [Bacteroidales bacterium]